MSGETRTYGNKHTNPLKHEDAQNRRAALELAVGKKIELEKRALQIVERLMEDDVTEDFLLGCGRFITLADYKDTVDERFIIKLCGYPLCRNKLEKVPKQKYKISTKTNKVYDITERKCFCSNFCYRASKYFESQIPQSPLWMREEERPADFKLLKPGQSGHSGEEVKLYDKSILLSDIENPRVSASHRKSNFSSESDKDSDSEQEFVSAVLTEKRSRAQSLKPQPPKTSLPSEKYTPETKAINKEQEHMMLEIAEELSKCKVDDKDKTNTTTVSFQTKELCAPGTDLTPDKLQTSEESECNPSGSQITSRGVSKRGAEHLRRMLARTKQPLKSDSEVPLPPPTIKGNMLEALIKTFSEWKTDETMEFLYGPQSTSRSEKEELDTDDLPLETVGLCDSEDHSSQKSHSSLNESVSAKALPNFERLKGETAMLNLTAKEFYKGVYKDRDVKQDDPVLPLVDSSAQHQIRKRIVLDRLKKVLPVILVPLQITYSEVYAELHNLIKTFRLTNKNIYHKNTEWSLIAIVLLSILSPKISHKDAQKSPLYTQFISTFLEELHFQNEDLETLINIFASNSAVE
uniref:RNA polymerase II subunit B1 CTD phosphatase RPAP2 homolog n=1 Tax=Geotrypetes seraphini TaxID=260995 RepID=A0A6P8N744_GEOSA|nr:putative RNA polymerase II subunit B1 CTD phosphatase RPAP2 isoform X2 [Geotrypetes seraphini]